MKRNFTLSAMLAVVINFTIAERSPSHEILEESDCTFFCVGGSHATGLLQSLYLRNWDPRIDLNYFTHGLARKRTDASVEESCEFSTISVLPIIAAEAASDAENAIHLWISSRPFREDDFKIRLQRLAPAVSDDDSHRLFQLTKELCAQADEPLQVRIAAAIFLESTSPEQSLLLFLLTLSSRNAVESTSSQGSLTSQILDVATQCEGICSIASYVSLHLRLKRTNVLDKDFDTEMAARHLALASKSKYCYPFRAIDGRKDAALTVSMLVRDVSGNALGPFSMQFNEHDFMECVRSGEVDTQPRMLLRTMLSELISSIKFECHSDPVVFRSFAFDIELLLLRCLQSDDFELQTKAIMHHFDFRRIYEDHFGCEWRLSLADQNVNVFRIGLIEKDTVFRQPLVSYYQLLHASESAAKRLEQKLEIEQPPF